MEVQQAAWLLNGCPLLSILVEDACQVRESIEVKHPKLHRQFYVTVLWLTDSKVTPGSQWCAR